MAPALSVWSVCTEESSLLDQLNKQISQIHFPSAHREKGSVKEHYCAFQNCII